MKIEQLADILKGDLRKKTKNKITGYCIDTRTLKKGDVYFAISGKVTDGHKFVEDAILKKASTIVVSSYQKEWLRKKVNVIVVDDTTLALIRLASFFRMTYPIPLIAITGSVGKTTTKELVYEVLKKKYSVLKSPKNFNNRIGVPLTLLNLNQSYDCVVMEMGMNHLGEIHELSVLCKPEIGVITNIGTAHIGFLNGQKNIKKAKLEILDGMEQGSLLVNGLDPMLQDVQKEGVSRVLVGKESVVCESAQFYPEYTVASINIQGDLYSIKYYLPGDKMLPNILLAIQIGLIFSVPITDILDAIEEYMPNNKRLHRIVLNDNLVLIDDSYNASLESLENDLTILKVTEGKKVLILGDFLELGKYSKKIHRKALRKIKKVPHLETYLVGKETNRYRYFLRHKKGFSDVLQLQQYLEKHPLCKGTILVKGSRKVGLDQIVTYLKRIS